MGEPAVIGIEEVVIAVKDADKAVALFKDLFGLKFDVGWDMPHEKMRVKSDRIAGTQLQFLEPTGPEGVIAKFIDAKGEGLNHFAFRVSNLEAMVKELKAKGVRMMPGEPVRMKIPWEEEGKEELSYIFTHPKSTCGVLIELIEVK
ncbi:MAG: VOC family protein [Dehalococcoidia bacterium]|nr:VOC family protein [Dehalococcoidia bacterium]